MSGVSDLERLRADAARRAVGHGHGGRLPERLAIPEPVAVIAPVLLLAILYHLHSRQFRVRRAVLWAVGDQPDLQAMTPISKDRQLSESCSVSLSTLCNPTSSVSAVRVFGSRTAIGPRCLLQTSHMVPKVQLLLSADGPSVRTQLWALALFSQISPLSTTHCLDRREPSRPLSGMLTPPAALSCRMLSDLNSVRLTGMSSPASPPSRISMCRPARRAHSGW